MQNDDIGDRTEIQDYSGFHALAEPLPDSGARTATSRNSACWTLWIPKGSLSQKLIFFISIP